MDNEYLLKRPVMGPLAKIWRGVFLALLLVVTAALLYCALKLFPERRDLLLYIMGGVDVVLLLLAYFIPRVSFYSQYSYTLSEEEVTLYQRDEAVMHMKWEETDVALGSYIRKGNINKPKDCAPAICFARTGAMRNPPRFPKRAMKGAAGEFCVAFSKARLRDIYALCGGRIHGEVSADGLRLSENEAATMADAFARIKEKTEKEAARAAAQEAKAAEREVRAAERQAKAQTIADKVLNLGASPESKEGGESAGDDTQV